ncbi:acetate--CoA ligase family protein [Hydrogenophaga palleronii]|uniref:acetate--CoA ligase family protein n=1 Tax=Hydrogenophaga palleronii TaxID=65655 RepID=UPI0008241435|nr:acetate--CoA ligase family protein [Hydrogenophaga palleronii]
MTSSPHPLASRAVLSPTSIAVIGASSDAERIGGIPIANLLSQGFAGDIWPVNPSRDTVQGLRSFASVDALPGAPEAAIVAVPADLAVAAVEELARIGTRSAIVFSAGFAETGERGIAMQAQMADAAREHGMRLFGPNTIGLFNAHANYYPFFTTAFERGFPRGGRVGIASQSGAFGSQIFNIARNRRIGTPICITTGNEADVTIGEAIGWLAEDDNIDVIVAYLEGLREPEKFLAALETARRARKPVIVLKAGRSVLGASAVQSHTASIAGDDKLFDVTLSELGAVRVEHVEEMLDVAHVATRRIFPVSGTLGALTLSGGAGIQISDAAEKYGLDMPQLDPDAQAELKRLLPIASPVNPIDITAQSLNNMGVVAEFAKVVAERGNYAAIVAYLAGVGGSAKKGPELQKTFGDVARAHPDRLWAMLTTAEPHHIEAFEREGLLVFEESARAVNAIAAMSRLGQAFARPTAVEPAPLPGPALSAKAPNEAEAKAWLSSHGIAVTQERVVSTEDLAVQTALEFGYPVVLKIVSPDILHKSEVNGVKLNLRDDEAVRLAYREILASVAQARPDARIEGILVARQVENAVECLMSIHRDPQLGLFAAFGLGGIYVEILKDVAFARCPFDETRAEALIRSIRCIGLLTGARGRPSVDVPALARTLSRLSHIAHQHGERLQSIELNPVLALPEGQAPVAADALIELLSAPGAEGQPA